MKSMETEVINLNTYIPNKDLVLVKDSKGSSHEETKVFLLTNSKIIIPQVITPW